MAAQVADRVGLGGSRRTVGEEVLEELRLRTKRERSDERAAGSADLCRLPCATGAVRSGRLDAQSNRTFPWPGRRGGPSDVLSHHHDRLHGRRHDRTHGRAVQARRERVGASKQSNESNGAHHNLRLLIKMVGRLYAIERLVSMPHPISMQRRCS